MSIRSITVRAALAAVTIGIGLGLAGGTANATDGMLKVGTDIQPGIYQVKPIGGSGYFALCADAGCRIDFDGSDATGMIDNEIVSGPSYMEVGPGVTYVKVTSLKIG
jgi:hypothetical protein